MNTDFNNIPNYIYSVYISTNKPIEDSNWTTRDEARARRKILLANGNRKVTILRYSIVVEPPVLYRD